MVVLKLLLKEEENLENNYANRYKIKANNIPVNTEMFDSSRTLLWIACFFDTLSLGFMDFARKNYKNAKNMQG